MKSKKEITDNGPLAAARIVMEILDNMTITDKLYQGSIDITEHINFQDIASQFDLTQEEYDGLINDTQELVDGAVRRYFKQIKAKNKIGKLVERRKNGRKADTSKNIRTC